MCASSARGNLVAPRSHDFSAWQEPSFGAPAAFGAGGEIDAAPTAHASPRERARALSREVRLLCRRRRGCLPGRQSTNREPLSRFRENNIGVYLLRLRM